MRGEDSVASLKAKTSTRVIYFYKFFWRVPRPPMSGNASIPVLHTPIVYSEYVGHGFGREQEQRGDALSAGG